MMSRSNLLLSYWLLS